MRVLAAAFSICLLSFSTAQAIEVCAAIDSPDLKDKAEDAVTKWASDSKCQPGQVVHFYLSKLSGEFVAPLICDYSKQIVIGKYVLSCVYAGARVKPAFYRMAEHQ